MGTFIIRPTAIASGGTPFSDGSAPNYAGWATNGFPTFTILDSLQQEAALVDALVACANNNGGGPNSFQQTLRINFTGACIYLDGSLTPIAFASLPVGFTALTAAVKVIVDSLDTPIPPGFCHYYLQQTVFDTGTVDTDTFPYDMSFPTPTMLDIVSNGCGFKVDISTISAENNLVRSIYNLRVEGTYSAISFTWNLQVPDDPVETGTEITVTSPDVDFLDFDDVEDPELTYIDENGDLQTIAITVIREQTSHRFVFHLPTIPIDAKVITINVTGDGTQFSGSIALGRLITIYFTDATGIYKLVVGKRSDTLYDTTDPGSTVDVKIPNPFIKTALLP